MINKFLNEKDIKSIKALSTKISTTKCHSLDEIVELLINERNNGNSFYYATFMGKALYSVDVTLDSAYQECLGCTKEEWDNRKSNNNIVNSINYSKRIPYFVTRGKKYINPDKMTEWKELCKISQYDSHYQTAIEEALYIMKLLEKDSDYQKILKKLEKEDEGNFLYYAVLNIIINFSHYGESINNYIHPLNSDKKLVKNK